MFKSMIESLRITSMTFFLGRLKRYADRGEISNIAIWGLILAWGNIFYSAGWRYLREVVAHTLATDKDILECGSGLTTVIMGTLTESKNARLTVFEHTSGWLALVDKRLTALGINNVRLIHAPIERFGTYSWYSAPDNLFTEKSLELIVCDGPPATTSGGRFGLIPKTSPFIADSCTILLDDTHRRSEQRVLKIWRQLIDFKLIEKRGFIGRSSTLSIERIKNAS